MTRGQSDASLRWVMTNCVLSKRRAASALAGVACAVAVASTALAQQPAGPAAAGADFTAPATVDTARLKGPVQPIFYRHDVHAGQYKIDCKYCHFAVEISPHPGIPTLETCMGCHRIAGSGNPEVKKLREAYAAKKPMEWIRVHRLPPFVHFPHMRHVKAEVTCQTCHGEIQTMPRVSQYASLKMGWCLDCHIQRKVTTDCTACHF